MIIIGLTGIMGSGKSTVSASLRKRGLDVIDLDALARDSLNWKETLNDIRNAFGEEYIVDDKVNVERLRGVAFSKENLGTLEAMIHPRVRQRVRVMIAGLEEKRREMIFIDHPLLFEVGFYRRLDKVVVVKARMDVIMERLKKRGMEKGDVERRLSFQIPLEIKEKTADYIIDNSGTEEELEKEVDALLEKITKAGGIIRCI